jgi:hypothetical protein
MRTRKRALETFYSGPDWRAHASAANATMIDVDNELLLRPLSGLRLRHQRASRTRQPGNPPKGRLIYADEVPL